MSARRKRETVVTEAISTEVATVSEEFTDAVPLFADVERDLKRGRKAGRRAAGRYMAGVVGCETVEGFLAADQRVRDHFGARSGTRGKRDALKILRTSGKATERQLSKLDGFECAQATLDLAAQYKSRVAGVAVRLLDLDVAGKKDVWALIDADGWGKVREAFRTLANMEHARRYGRFGGTLEEPAKASRKSPTEPTEPTEPTDPTESLPEDLAGVVTELLEAIEAGLDAKAREAAAGILTFHAERIRRARTEDEPTDD